MFCLTGCNGQRQWGSTCTYTRQLSQYHCPNRVFVPEEASGNRQEKTQDLEVERRGHDALMMKHADGDLSSWSKDLCKWRQSRTPCRRQRTIVGRCWNWNWKRALVDEIVDNKRRWLLYNPNQHASGMSALIAYDLDGRRRVDKRTDDDNHLAESSLIRTIPTHKIRKLLRIGNNQTDDRGDYMKDNLYFSVTYTEVPSIRGWD